MQTLSFAGRNTKEVLRDPLTIAFGLGFPLIVLFLLSAIQANVPISLFEIDRLSPGVAVFGLSFISLFSGMLIAKDRDSSFLIRLFASPLRASDYILGYALPFLPIALAQIGITLLAALFLGLRFNAHLLALLGILLITAVLFIAFGMLAGSVFNEKQVGVICGALLANLSAWLSGIWFDVDLVGGWFRALAEALPFIHAVEAARSAVAGDFAGVFPSLWWVIAYAMVALVAAVIAFRRNMEG